MNDLPVDLRLRWTPFKNAGGSTIPAFSAMRISGLESDKRTLQAQQPNVDGQDVYINGPLAVAVGDYGECTYESPVIAIYETSDGTPANGETWGAASGTYKLRKNKAGFCIEGGAGAGDEGQVTVRRPGGAAGTQAKFIRFSLASALLRSDASQAVCPVDDYWEGTSPGATVTVYNMPASSNYIFSGVTGAKGVAVYDEIDNKYWIVQMQCGGGGISTPLTQGGLGQDVSAWSGPLGITGGAAVLVTVIDGGTW